MATILGEKAGEPKKKDRIVCRPEGIGKVSKRAVALGQSRTSKSLGATYLTVECTDHYREISADVMKGRSILERMRSFETWGTSKFFRIERKERESRRGSTIANNGEAA